MQYRKNTKVSFVLWFTVLVLIFSEVNGANILAFFLVPSISHQYVFQAIWKELSLRGHNVTVITPNPLNEPKHVNLTEINVNIGYKIFEKYDFSHVRRETLTVYNIIKIFKEAFFDAYELETEQKEVQKIFKKPVGTFDLILIDNVNIIAYGLQHKFQAPLIAISTTGLSFYFHFTLGNSVHPVLYPDVLTETTGRISMLQKFDSFYVAFISWFICKYNVVPDADRIARQYFGHDMPHIEEIIKSSLMFVNVNPLFSDNRPIAPNVMEFFNIHLSRQEDISEDLQEILNNAKKGAVYFSLGTNVRFDHVQGNIKESLMEALGSLPYTVLCKWESEDYPGRPKNVILRKWFPQQSVLAHQNIKVFVTQGGLQSSEEAIINAVPLVVIPFLGDQPMNAKILQGHGMAETISPKELTKEKLREAILKVAQNEKYRQKAKELRGIFLDQPQSGIDKIIWWCEYVIRHKGAKHLRSPGADIPLYEYFMLDILAVLTAAVFGIFIILRTILRQIIRLVKNTKTGSTEKKKL